MKRLSLFLFIFLAGCTAAPIQPSQPPPTPLVWNIYFSPNGGCTEAIVKDLESAKAFILVQAYSFTCAPIAKALVAAQAFVSKTKAKSERGKVLKILPPFTWGKVVGIISKSRAK